MKELFIHKMKYNELPLPPPPSPLLNGRKLEALLPRVVCSSFSQNFVPFAGGKPTCGMCGIMFVTLRTRGSSIPFPAPFFFETKFDFFFFGTFSAKMLHWWWGGERGHNLGGLRYFSTFVLTWAAGSARCPTAPVSPNRCRAWGGTAIAGRCPPRRSPRRRCSSQTGRPAVAAYSRV